MTAYNINVEELVDLLNELRHKGTALINMDMVPDESYPQNNKLIIHPIVMNDRGENMQDTERPHVIRNPSIRRDNNDIFDALNDLL